jgi:hypothetical protein
MLQTTERKQALEHEKHAGYTYGRLTQKTCDPFTPRPGFQVNVAEQPSRSIVAAPRAIKSPTRNEQAARWPISRD